MKIQDKKLLELLDTYKENTILTPFRKYLVQAIGKESHHFFDVSATHYLVKLASLLQMTVTQKNGATNTVNMYSLALLPSGFGKTRTISILQNKIFNDVFKLYTDRVSSIIGTSHLDEYKLKMSSIRTDLDEETVSTQIDDSMERAGPVDMEYCEGTIPGLKQIRNKLGILKVGSLNIEIDEIGYNLSSSEDVFKLLFELSENGQVSSKATKNTKDSPRGKGSNTSVPTNLLAFGTPAKLLNYGKDHALFIKLLTEGYARRFMYVYEPNIFVNPIDDSDLDAYFNECEQIEKDSLELLRTIKTKLLNIMSIVNANLDITFETNSDRIHRRYSIDCMNRSTLMSVHDDLLKAQMENRPYLATKIAAAYAIYEESTKIKDNHYIWAMQLCETSGEHFIRVINRPPSYVDLAEYIINCKHPLVETELLEKLPYYKGTLSARAELMNLAKVHAISNGSIIKQTTSKGIMYTEGSVLEKTKLSGLKISVSKDLAKDYIPTTKASLDNILKLIRSPKELNFCVHAFKDNARSNNSAIPGFNLVVLDVDEGVSIGTVKFLLQDYVYIIYTTKSHTQDINRFRVILPMENTLYLPPEEYKEFMNNIYSWLFFDVDTGTNDAARKWATNPRCTEEGQEVLLNIDENTKMLPVLQFLSGTTENALRETSYKNFKNVDRLKSWFLFNTKKGNRNSMMFRYIRILIEKYSHHMEDELMIDTESVVNEANILNKSLEHSINFTEMQSLLNKNLGEGTV